MVIPHRCRLELLARAVASAAGHSVLVVNDSGAVLPPVQGAEVVGEPGPARGFAASANLGLAIAQSRGFPWVLVLNDDAVLSEDCIGLLLGRTAPSLGAAGPAILEEGRRLGGFDVAGWGRVHQSRAPEGPVRSVSALSGACILLPSWARFDTAYSHGFEDLDLCLRMQELGRSVLLVPSATCAHSGGASLPRASREAQRHALSGHLRLFPRRRHLPAVLGLALAQVIRDGCDAGRLAGLVDGLMDRGYLSSLATRRASSSPGSMSAM